MRNLLEGLDLLNPGIELIVIDEIGKMELLSNRFRGLIQEIMISEKQLLATIALKGEGLIQEIKRRSGVRLFELNPANRDRLQEEIVEG